MGKKVSRKQLIKGGAGGALAIGVLGPGAAPAFADDDNSGGSMSTSTETCRATKRPPRR